MTIVLLIIITILGAIASWFAGRRSAAMACSISLATLLAGCMVLIAFWAGFYTEIAAGPVRCLASFSIPWISSLGINFSFAVDGFALMLITLTVLIGICAVVVSGKSVFARAGFFYFNIMLAIAGIIGVFAANDLFLFYFFWELMLVPMYFLIAIYGGSRRVYAAIRFFIFTQAGGLLMLVAIVALYTIHGRSTGIYTFSYDALLDTARSHPAAQWIMLGFVIAFAVKMPVVPLHTWVRDAYAEAPPAGTIIFAAILSKTGAYGFIRFVLPLFPAESMHISFCMMVLGVISILYCALTALGQSDIKRFLAYTSVSHLGFVLLGIFSTGWMALQGAIIIMLAHGLSITALFIIAAGIERRLDTRELTGMGGLWRRMPRMAGFATFFMAATLGLPGLANFVGEFLVLAGTFAVSPVLASIAALGLITSVIYSVWFIYRVFQGFAVPDKHVSDLELNHAGMLAILVAAVLWMGLYPRPVIKTTESSVKTIGAFAVPAQRQPVASVSQSLSPEGAQ